jgi:serine/threonine protein kinase
MERKIANRYRILSLIGQGGMGQVHEAYDELLKRTVAIKLIAKVDNGLLFTENESDGESEPQSVLMKEAQMMARVHHPNVMPVHDLIQDSDGLYIVMPLLAGTWGRLRQDVLETPLLDTVRFLERVADALDFLHRHNIIHRDLKPDNIMMSFDKQPYITDFGLAHDADFFDGQLAGTLAYMPPEILADERATPAADIYAFGIIVYEAIAGGYPFKISGVNELIQSIMYAPMPSIELHRTELAKATVRDIDAVIAKLTAKVPSERYTTAMEAINDLYRVVYSGQQIFEGKLFLSYARKDQTFVYTLADELRRYSVDVWIDRNIEYGSTWDESIDNQLRDCDVMVVIATPDAMQSSYVTYEWSYFIGANKPIFPFVPATVSGDRHLHPRLSRVQYLKGSEDMTQNVRQIIEVMSQAMKRRTAAQE